MEKKQEIIDIEEYVKASKVIPRNCHYKFKVDGKKYKSTKDHLTGQEILQIVGKDAREALQIIQKFRFERTEILELGETVDLAVSGVEEFVIAYKFVVNNKEFTHSKEWITGQEILQVVGVSPKGSLPVQLFRFGRTEIVELDEKVDLATSGVEKFTLSFQIKVDKVSYTWNDLTINGQQIFNLIGKSPNQNNLVQKLKNNQVNPVGLTEEIDLTQKGIEKFVTIPSDATEGFVKKQTFILPEEDRFYLETLSNEWEAVKDGNNQWLIIRDYVLPKGYNHEKTDVALLIPRTYPTAQIDMMYFSNHLSRKDGKPIKALSKQNIQNKSWQRWSRHRTPQNPWRRGIDNVSTHIVLVQNLLTKELEK